MRVRHRVAVRGRHLLPAGRRICQLLFAPVDECDASADCAGAGRPLGTRHGVYLERLGGPDLLAAAAVCGISVFNGESPRSRLLAMGYRTDASDAFMAQVAADSRRLMRSPYAGRI